MLKVSTETQKSVQVPPATVQGRLLPNPYKKANTDHWEYAISKVWLDRWISSANPAELSYLSPSSGSSSMTSSRGSSLASNGQEEVKTLGPVMVCDIDVENAYIPETAWELLLSWYGLEDSSMKRRRHFVNIYIPLAVDGSDQSHVLSDKYLDILMVNVCHLAELDQADKHQILQLYAWDTVAFWEQQLKTALKVPRHCDARLWLFCKHDGNENSMLLLTRSPQSFMQFICEIQPELVNYLLSRQHQPPAPELQVAFTSFQSTQRSGSFEGGVGNRSYLFQELLQQKYHVTIALETITVGETDFQTTSSLDVSCKPKDTVNEWEKQLQEILDQIYMNIHKTTDEQKDQVESVCKAVVSNTVEEMERICQNLKEKTEANEAKAKSLAALEKDLSERETVLNKKLQKFKTGLADFLVEKKRLEDELKKIEQINKIAESKIKLNVGGQHFETSIETVTREPHSVLGLMFSGRHAIKQEPDGCYFIDRDGTNFRYILNFLRDGKDSLTTIPSDVKLLRELHKEATFYGLEELRCFLKQKVGA